MLLGVDPRDGRALSLGGAGVALGSYFIGRGFYIARAGERFVSVKGLAERNVKADLAVWTISYTATGGGLAEANAVIAQDQALVTAFATTHGFAAAGRDSNGENGAGDDQSSLEKKVRLVSSIDYFLVSR